MHQPLLYVLFGFFVFSPFFWVDERAEANLGRAAAFAYVSTLIALMATFVLLIGVVDTGGAGGHRDLLRTLALSLAGIYGVHIISFVGSYVYFEYRGV